MKELDVVKLVQDFNGLPAGTEGTIVLEYDGTAYEETRYVSYVQPSTGLVQNYQFNFTCYSEDTIMSELTYPRETILSIDLDGEEVWWKEDAVSWTYDRR